MALELLTSKTRQLTKEEKDSYSFLAKDAWDKPWWRRFIKQIQDQLDVNLMLLVNGMDGKGGGLDQRREDRLRGEISALSLILSVDEFARQQNDPKFQAKEERVKEANNAGTNF